MIVRIWHASWYAWRRKNLLIGGGTPSTAGQPIGLLLILTKAS